MAPHKQRPRITGLLGNIPSFKAQAGRVAAKYVSKVNAADNFAHMPLDNLFLFGSYVPVMFFTRVRKHVDWDLAIKRNREALKGIVEALFAMLDATAARIPKHLHSAVLLVLRPAESAMRRLIVIAARDLVGKLAASRPMPKGQMIGKGDGSRLPSFQLFDTRKDFPELRQRRVKYAKHPPRILFFGDDSRVDSLWPSPPPLAAPVFPSDGLVNAARITRRLGALKLALDDLPRQARRMARWRARREAAKNPKFKSPLRPGPPPGRRKRRIHEVDEILANCHWLAWEALKPDTS